MSHNLWLTGDKLVTRVQFFDQQNLFWIWGELSIVKNYFEYEELFWIWGSNFDYEDLFLIMRNSFLLWETEVKSRSKVAKSLKIRKVVQKSLGRSKFSKICFKSLKCNKSAKSCYSTLIHVMLFFANY